MNIRLTKLIMVTWTTGRGSSVKVGISQFEGHGSDSPYRRSTSQIHVPLLTAGPFGKLMCIVVALPGETKGEIKLERAKQQLTKYLTTILGFGNLVTAYHWFGADFFIHVQVFKLSRFAWSTSVNSVGYFEHILVSI